MAEEKQKSQILKTTCSNLALNKGQPFGKEKAAPPPIEINKMSRKEELASAETPTMVIEEGQPSSWMITKIMSKRKIKIQED